MKKKTIVLILIFLYFSVSFLFYIYGGNLKTANYPSVFFRYFYNAYLIVWPVVNFVFVTWVMLYLDGKVEKKENVYLKHNSSDFFYRLFEYLFWGRTSMYRNEHSGNVIFFNSLYIVSAWVCIILFFVITIFSKYEVCLDEIGAKDVLIFYFTFMSLVATVYWKEREKYKEKWEYICEMYNKYLEAEYECGCSNDSDEKKQRKIMIIRNAIAIDSIVILMWNHRSISSLIREEIVIAVKALSCFDDNKVAFRIKNNYFSENEMIYILEEYQKRILNKRCCDKCDMNSIDRCINFNKSNWMELHKYLCVSK